MILINKTWVKQLTQWKFYPARQIFLLLTVLAIPLKIAGIDPAVINLARGLQKTDDTIHKIIWFVLSTLIHWIAIYPVHSFIQASNNRGLKLMQRSVHKLSENFYSQTSLAGPI